ncbi:putative quinol monooxygenase [Streptomyces sp. NRRL F-525]|uniref:putative quinol monooxygenase n=1 Tax=Streptomyces sp. NRRL F-525 TaxID=1463861 RepID=UPI003B632090
MAPKTSVRIVELVREVRSEPSCVTFTAYEAGDVPGRFYLYEVYTEAATFAARPRAKHVHRFISAIPTLSTGARAASSSSTNSPSPSSS